MAGATEQPQWQQWRMDVDAGYRMLEYTLKTSATSCIYLNIDKE
jgi:hypothetical protein